MKPRELKSKLAILRKAGVLSYREGDLAVTFQSTNEHEAPHAPVSEDDGNEPAGAGPEQMQLPDGVFDPLGRIAEINRRASRSS